MIAQAKADKTPFRLSNSILIKSKVGLTDQDIFGHMTNTRYGAFARIALDAWLIRTGLFHILEDKQIRLTLRQENTQFIRILSFPQPFELSFQLEEITQKLLCFSYEVVSREKISATGSMQFGAQSNSESLDFAALVQLTGTEK